MPKPKSKIELEQACVENFEKLMECIEKHSKEKQHATFSNAGLNQNIRDVLMHLHEWHLMFLSWYEEGMKGAKPDMPAEGYTWKDLPRLNRMIWKNCQKVTLAEAKKKVKASHSKIFKLIKASNEQELFTKKKYKWTGSTSLAAYLISNSSSHYHWAFNVIKKGLRDA